MSKVVDNYIIQEEIGTGQFSVVHRGRHMLTNEQVAIKVLRLDRLESNPQIKENLDEEVRALKLLDSPHIIKNLKMLRTAHNIYEIYEYYDQGSLYGQLHKRQYLPEREALLVFRDLVSAIRILYQHSRLVITRHYSQGHQTREYIPQS